MKARILVLNGFVKGWNVLKSLADDGFEVNCGHHTPDAPGLFSNRVGDRSGNLIYPNPKTDEKAFVATVLEHIGRVKFDVVLPVNAAEMMALARHKDRISQFALFPFENYYKLLLLHDKKYFFELMAARSEPEILPRSWSIGDQTPPINDIIAKAGIGQTAFQPMDDYPTVEHFLNAHPGIIYPLMVKTRRATSAVGIYRINNETELRTACRILGEIDIIVQEILAGRGVGISFVRWDRPPMLYHFGHKRVREYPIAGGASTSREPWNCDDHPLTAATGDLLNRLDWHGVVMFELKEIDDGGGRPTYKFLEANPRFWGSVPLAIVNGVNFPALLCRAALGLNHPPVRNLNRYRARIFFSDTLSMVLNVLHGRRVWYNLRDYFDFRRLKIDDIDFGDFPATRKIFRRMTAEFISRLRNKQP